MSYPTNTIHLIRLTEEVARRSAKSIRNLPDFIEADRLLPSFNAPHVRAIQTSPESKSFLRQTALFA